MAICRECREPVSWGVKECPRCGESNPSGADPGDVMLVTGLISVLSVMGFALYKGAMHELFRFFQ
jgi:hypothetical protein